MNHTTLSSRLLDLSTPRSLAALALGLAGAAAHAQTIYNVTERAEPGDSIAIAGSGLAAASKVTVTPILEGKDGAALSALVTYQDNNEIVATVPANAPAGMYRVTVATPTSKSNDLYVNRPRVQWIDTATAAPNEKVRIVGRNLKPGAAAPIVRLQNNKTLAYVTATIVSADNDQLVFRVPSNVQVGQTYKVFVDNGLPGAVSEVNSGLFLTMAFAGTDPFNLGTTWAKDFMPVASAVYNVRNDSRLNKAKLATGDGKQDDTAAVQAAIDLAASKGGGVVYLPAGTYRLDGAASGFSLTLAPRVVLKGDGIGKTIVQIGYNYTAAKAPDRNRFWMYMKDPGLNGLSSLTVQNLNTNAASNSILRQGMIGNAALGTNGNVCGRMFLADVDFQMGNGWTITMSCINQVAIERCKFVSNSKTDAPIMLLGDRYLNLENNYFDYPAGRIAFQSTEKSTVIGNTFRIDNGRQAANVETGGIELSLGRQLLVADNTIVGYGGVRKTGGAYNDGELILTQNNLRDFYDIGSVKSAGAMMIAPAGKSWPAGSWQVATHMAQQRTQVAIVDGKGAGQWRWVTAHTANSLTTDTPWDVVPDSTSVYCISCVSNYQQTYLRNRIEGGTRSIEFYNGAMDSAINGNILKDTGGIMLRAEARPLAVSGVNGNVNAQALAWGNSIADNVLTNTQGVRTASISLPMVDAYGSGYGAAMLHNLVRGNQISGAFTKVEDFYGMYDGIEMFNLLTAAPTGTVSKAKLVGTVLSKNSVTGSANPFRLSGGKGTVLDGVAAGTSDSIDRIK